MKKAILLLLIVLLCLPVVLAGTSTTIKDDWIPYYTTFTANGNEYSIRSSNAHFDDESKGLIVIRKNGELITQVYFGECAQTTEYKYCFENRSFDNNLMDIDSNGNLQPALRVKLIEYSYSDGLEITRSFSKTNLYLGETAEVTMTVKNTGDYPIYNIKVTEPVPENIKINSYDERLAKAGNKLMGNFNLYPGSSWTASYFIKSLTYNTSEKYQTEVTYLPENKNETLSKNSVEQTVKVISPYTINTGVNYKSIDINNKIFFTLEVVNDEDTDIDVENINVRIPSRSQGVIKNNLRQDKDYLYINYNEKVVENDSIEYTVEAIMPYAGSYEFTYSGTVNTKGYIYEFSGSVPFEVVTEGISCSVLTNSSNINSGDRYEYVVEINNNDNEIFYEVQGKTPGLENQYMENILSKQKRILINETERADVVFEKASKNISFSGKYRTVNNQWFDLDCEKIIDINPTVRMLDIKLVPSQGSVKRNENMTVDVYVKNLMDFSMNNVKVSSGLWSDEISLEAHENRTIHTIPVSIVDKYVKSTYSMDLDVEIPSREYKDSYTLDINVSNPYVPPSIKESSDDSSSANSDSDNSDGDVKLVAKTGDEGKKSLIEKIKYLLKSIFG